MGRFALFATKELPPIILRLARFCFASLIYRSLQTMVLHEWTKAGHGGRFGFVAVGMDLYLGDYATYIQTLLLLHRRR